MKLVKTEEAVGHVLCHDMTQIVSGKGKTPYKGPRFRKGHVVAKEDIPVLLAMGKEHLYVWDTQSGMLHENDAAKRMASFCLGSNCKALGEPSEGKIMIAATRDGVFIVDSQRLAAVNAVDQVMVATRKGKVGVRSGDILAGTRVIPLVVCEAVVAAAEAAADTLRYGPLMQVKPYCFRTAAIIATGSEVAHGLVEDTFTPVIERKLQAYGITTDYRVTPGDDINALVSALNEARASGVDLVVCTGGMSVDPDDNTPGAIKRSGARIVTYGVPVLPGAMFLMGYYDDLHANAAPDSHVAVVGLPGCAMYNAATVFDLVLPRIVAGIELSKEDFVELGEGGLCLSCPVCSYPVCPFGK